jgi:hypothetical protein
MLKQQQAAELCPCGNEAVINGLMASVVVIFGVDFTGMIHTYSTFKVWPVGMVHAFMQAVSPDACRSWVIKRSHACYSSMLIFNAFHAVTKLLEK